MIGTKTIANDKVRHRERKWLARAVASVAACALIATSTIAASPSASLAAKSQAQRAASAQEEIAGAASALSKAEKKVSKAQDSYNAAQDKMKKVRAQMKRLQRKADAIEKRIEPYREQLAAIAKWEYVQGSESFWEMVLTDSLTFSEFIDQSNHLEKIAQTKAAAIEAVSVGESEIEEALAEKRERESEYKSAMSQARRTERAARKDASALEKKIGSLRDEQREYLLGKGTAGGGAAYAVPKRGDVVDYALSRVGCPYVWGASGESSFDCSGLVMWAYERAYGISLPHYTESQKAAARKVVPLSEAQPGDVLYRPGHVGICTKAGAKEYVHAPHSGAYVRINDNNSYSQFVCALRFR